MGGANLFPGLGFDPAPGDLGAVTGLGSALTQAQKQLSEACTTVHQMTSGTVLWEGRAAAAFASRVAQLPQHLDTAQQAFGAAARELDSWQDKLVEMKAQAREYETEAVSARARYERAANNPDLSLLGDRFGSKESLDQAQQRYDAAVAELNAAEGALQAVITQAKRLLAQHQRAVSDVVSVSRLPLALACWVRPRRGIRAVAG
jgi:uncharacterized protein YukE